MFYNSHCVSFHKFTIVQTILFIYNCHNNRTYVRKKGPCEPMNKKQELIERIEKLSPEQFELLISLYSQQEQEFVQDVPIEHPSFLQPSL